MTHQTVFRVFLFVTLLSSLHSFASRSFAQTKHAPVRQSTAASGQIHGVGGEELGRPTSRPLDPLAVPVFSVAPGKAATIFFWCVDDQGTLIPNCSIQLQYRMLTDSATDGHNHSNSSRPKGTFVPESGNTGSARLQTTNTAPAVAGQVEIEIHCSLPNSTCNTGVITGAVKISGLIDLESVGSASFTPVGGLPGHPEHPVNHYGTPTMVQSVVKLANDYKSKYGDALAYNDISLRWGGIFDLHQDWQKPHKGHNLGTHLDVGLVPPERRSTLLHQAWSNNLGVLIESSPPHWHLSYGNPAFCRYLQTNSDCSNLNGADPANGDPTFAGLPRPAAPTT